MARGWESKAIESQQADTGGSADRRPPLSPEARARLDRKEMLTLSLARVRDELARASQPAHRAMLERAAIALDAEISALSS
jgi:hypothetical protein